MNKGAEIYKCTDVFRLLRLYYYVDIRNDHCERHCIQICADKFTSHFWHCAHALGNLSVRIREDSSAATK